MKENSNKTYSTFSLLAFHLLSLVTLATSEAEHLCYATTKVSPMVN